MRVYVFKSMLRGGAQNVVTIVMQQRSVTVMVLVKLAAQGGPTPLLHFTNTLGLWRYLEIGDRSFILRYVTLRYALFPGKKI